MTPTGLPKPITPTTPRFATILIALLLLCQAAICFISAGKSLRGEVDLRAFYAAGTIVRGGHADQLYDYEYERRLQNVVIGHRANALPFLYPPFAALLFVPLSLLPYRLAFFGLLLFNVGLLFAIARLLSPWLPAFAGHSSLLLPSLYGCLFAVPVALMQGQISFVLLLAYSGTYVLGRQKLNFAAGLLLSVALIKFQIALPVILLFVLWRQWRVVSGFLVGAVGVIAVSLALVGRTGMMSYWHAMIGMAGSTARNAAAGKARYGMFPTDMPNLHGLTYGLSHGAAWGSLLNLVLCCVVLGWAMRRKASLLVALPAAMLVSYHMQPHDLTLLLLPLSFAGNEFLLRRRVAESAVGSGQRQLIHAGMLCAVLLLLFPLAGIVMVDNIGYLVTVAVALVMVAVAADQGRAGRCRITVLCPTA